MTIANEKHLRRSPLTAACAHAQREAIVLDGGAAIILLAAFSDREGAPG
jgi:hypothetical protein